METPVLLKSIRIQKFRNFVEVQTLNVENDVTCLVGKNESGKTTILSALHRLNPANDSGGKFNLVTEYPRWRLARDRKANPELADLRPIDVSFSPSDEDLKKLEEIFGVRPPAETQIHAARSYADLFYVWLSADPIHVISTAAKVAGLRDDDLALLIQETGLDAAVITAKNLAKDTRTSGDSARASALTTFANSIPTYSFLIKIEEQDQRYALAAMIPKFFYFSSYNVLPGECDLTILSQKISAAQNLTDEERTVVSLLAHAGEQPADFMDADYNSRKAELQSASSDLSRKAFEYWQQNTDLDVEFDTDNLMLPGPTPGVEVPHRILKIELRDHRHGGVETNFSTRSTGFQWFFSFFAAFSEYQDSKDPIVVLLDEPGTSLHGDAQRDFIRFIFEELGASKQTMYTTHSQHMIDPTKYEKIRAVQDRATRADPDLGVLISNADLSADRGTLLPIESALGYSVSQHLFLGSGHHLAVEGSSDFVFLTRMTEILVGKGRVGLSPRLSIIPVGGADNMPAFVALLGRRLSVSALIDGARSQARYARIIDAAKHNDVDQSCIVICSDASNSLPTNADIEDLFAIDDYLTLYNWGFGESVTASDLAATGEPILRRIGVIKGSFDHAIPAHALTNRFDEFVSSVSEATLANFEGLFERLNATVKVASI
ncbi:MAG: AAA family ATPase [Acidimicrobiales bacterium]